MSSQENKPEEFLPENQRRYLQFNLGNESYAIELLSVKEVIPAPETTPLPNSPSYYMGIMNLRGQIISIIDLRKKMNIAVSDKDLEEAVVIVEYEGIGIGLVVDSINKVMNFNQKDIAEVPELSKQVNAKYIQGVYQGDECLTILLDMGSVLNIAEISKYQSKAS